MKRRLLFILCLFFVAASAAQAQRKTVSNADLEKFRQKRLQAENDYRQNYARLGFPSPEELEKRRAEERKNFAEFSARLRQEDAENERRARDEEFREAQQIALLSVAQQGYNRGAYVGNGFYGAYPYYYGYPNNFYRNNRFRREIIREGGRGFYNPGGFFSAGFVVWRGGGFRVGITSGGGFSGGRRLR